MSGVARGVGERLPLALRLVAVTAIRARLGRSELIAAVLAKLRSIELLVIFAPEGSQLAIVQPLPALEVLVSCALLTLMTGMPLVAGVSMALLLSVLSLVLS